VVVAYVFYFMAPDDIQFQVQMQGTFFAAAMAVAVCVMLAKVKERPLTELQLSDSKPVVPSMRAMFSNKPYMMYLLFNVPFKLAALIPVNLLIDYLKFNAKVPPPPPPRRPRPSYPPRQPRQPRQPRHLTPTPLCSHHDIYAHILTR
jgi:hypothetical protein